MRFFSLSFSAISPTTPLNIVVDVDVAAAFSSLFILFFFFTLRTYAEANLRSAANAYCNLFLFIDIVVFLPSTLPTTKKRAREKKKHIDKETKNIVFSLLSRSYFRGQYSNFNSRRISSFDCILCPGEWHSKESTKNYLNLKKSMSSNEILPFDHL